MCLRPVTAVAALASGGRKREITGTGLPPPATQAGERAVRPGQASTCTQAGGAVDRQLGAQLNRSLSAMTNGPCALKLSGAGGAEGIKEVNLSDLFRHSRGQDLTVGRKHETKGLPDVDLSLPDKSHGLQLSISRRHATLSLRLLRGHPVLEITNTGAHGTYVNGAKLGVGQKQQLKSGAVLSFADTPVISEAIALRGQPNPFAFVVSNVEALKSVIAEQSSDPADTDSVATVPVSEAQAAAPAMPHDEDAATPPRRKGPPADIPDASPPSTAPVPRRRTGRVAASTTAAAAAAMLSRGLQALKHVPRVVAGRADEQTARPPPGSRQAAEQPAAADQAQQADAGAAAGSASDGEAGGAAASDGSPAAAATAATAAGAATVVPVEGRRPHGRRKQTARKSCGGVAPGKPLPQAGGDGVTTQTARKTSSGRAPRGLPAAAGGAARAGPKRPAAPEAEGKGDKQSPTKRAKLQELPPVDIPEVVAGQELKWERDAEPWRLCGLPVNEELDLDPAKVELIHETGLQYFLKYRQAKGDEAERCKDGKHADGKQMSRRPDRLAQKKMNEQGLSMKLGKVVGHFPGLNITDRFFTRCHLSVCNMHFPPLAGIDYVSKGGKKNDQELYRLARGVTFATSIMVAGCYKDDQDDGHKLWYTGQGGNDLLGNKRQIADQDEKFGNAALIGNIRLGVPVRVTRKQPDPSTIYGSVFVYDGLYDVVKYIKEKGKDNTWVLRYKLVRRPNQGPVIQNRVTFGGSSAPPKLNPLSCDGIIDTDISGGLEATKRRGCQIPACNTIDNIPPPCSDLARMPTAKQVAGVGWHKPPVGWQPTCRYLIDYEMPAGMEWPAAPVLPAKYLAMPDDPHAWMRHLNGGTLPYVENKGTAPSLRDCKRLVYECGPWNPLCPDGDACIQRASQQGIRFRLQLVRTEKMGWGIISWDTIPSGAYVCHYYGKVMSAGDADEELDDFAYALDLGPRTDLDERDVWVPEGSTNGYVPKWVVDAKHAGGVGRFVNHGCVPNLFIQPILSRHHDQDLSYQAFFASYNIPAFTLLTFDYGSSYVKHQLGGKCLCGADACCSKQAAKAAAADAGPSSP